MGLLPYEKSVEAIGSAVKSGSDCAKTFKQRQSETEIIKDRKKLKEAVIIASDMFAVAYKYFDYFSDKDKKDFKRKHRKFIRRG